jgi:hypothetical protein
MDPFIRTYPRLGIKRNQACPCGSQRTFVDLKTDKEVTKGKKFKQCCIKQEWPEYIPTWPNNDGSYPTEIKKQRRLEHGKKEG